MSPRTWRCAMRLFRAVELLGSGASVTETALALGYASTSAFIYMIRSRTGQSPRRYAASERWVGRPASADGNAAAA